VFVERFVSPLGGARRTVGFRDDDRAADLGATTPGYPTLLVKGV